MHRTVEAIIHPDGRVEPLEPVSGVAPRRALLTILEEPPLAAAPPATDDTALDALLRAAGLQEEPDEIPADLEPLSEEALNALWARIPAGTPLSQIVIEDRDETF
jgi:hypothetical protein